MFCNGIQKKKISQPRTRNFFKMQNTSSSCCIDKDLKQTMIEKSIQTQKIAYCPYSKFHVGACILGENGTLYTGCNVENQSYGLTVCAERCAVMKMVSDGCHVIKGIAVSTNIGVTPCGACRQVLQEFVNEETKDFPIFIVNSETLSVADSSIKQLLPSAVDLLFLKN